MHIRNWLCCAVGTVLLAACGFQKADLAPDVSKRLEEADRGQIPVESFFKDAEYSQIVISPEGRYLAAIFPKNGRNAFAVLASDLSKPIFVGDIGDERHVLWIKWVSDQRLVLAAGKRYGYLDGRDTDVQLFFVDYDGKHFSDFSPGHPAHYEFVRTLPNDPDHVVMAEYDYRDRGRPMAVKVDVNTGNETMLAYPPMARGVFGADQDGQVNVALEPDADDPLKSQVYYRLGKGQDWQKLRYPVEAEGQVEPIHLDPASKTLDVVSNLETGKIGVYRLDLTTGKSRALSRDPTVDLSELVMDDDEVAGAWYQPEKPELEIIDKDSALMKLYADLSHGFPGETVQDVSLTRDKTRGVFKVSSDRNPGSFYEVDVATRKIRFLANARSWIDPKQMAEMKPFALKARDGLPLHGYLTLPPHGPQKNVPTVVRVHGGPMVRDSWSFDPEAQFLASRGFAVVQVNFRGSGGYGRRFEEAGWRQWGRAMQDDVTDATRWAISEGYADPKRLAIYGGSYGGYAALMGVVREPTLYRCAIDYAGVSDLPFHVHRTDAANSDLGEAYLAKIHGNDEKELEANSAVYNVDKIQVPILIAHGRDDVRVRFGNAEHLRDALEQAHKPYEWLVKDSEGHGFRQEANRFDLYVTMLAFLQKYLTV